MTSWIPSSIQKRLLRYAITRFGILDDDALDLDSFDITWGRRNTLEFKDVGLNVERIAKLAQLPPSLRLETARILLLRLTVPADFLSSGTSIEIDGIEVSARLGEAEPVPAKARDGNVRTAESAQSPSHRKTTRRIRSSLREHDGAHIPTTEDLARSFLQEEPIEGRRELEASVAANAGKVDESFLSQSSGGSGGSDIGTGSGPGLPAFLARWLQGVIDRFEVTIHNVQIKLDTSTTSDGDDTALTTVALKLGSAKLSAASSGADRREFRFENASIELLADSHVLSELSQIPSPAVSRTTTRTSTSDDLLDRSMSPLPLAEASFSPAQRSLNSTASLADEFHTLEPTNSLQHISDVMSDTDRFADAGDGLSESMLDSQPGLEIRAGDDNVSWTSRRSGGNLHHDVPLRPTPTSTSTSFFQATQATLPSSRASTSSGPSLERSRRAVSPYDRSFQSPGSWPRLEESPQRQRSRQSPGSWRAPDQSQHSMYQQPMTPAPAEDEDATDNKRNAFEASFEPSTTQPALPSPEYELDATPEEDLAQSRVFSHNEAESIYMSVMSHGKQSVQRYQMPGAWAMDDVASPRSVSPEMQRPLVQQAPSPPSLPTPGEHAAVQGLEPDPIIPEPPSGAATPRAQSPSPKSQPQASTNASANRVVTQLLSIDQFSVSIPIPRAESEPLSETTNAPPSRTATGSRVGLPGTFSAYSEMTSTRRRGSSLVTSESDSVVWAPSQVPATPAKSSHVEVRVGVVKAQFDVSCAQLLYSIGTQISAQYGDTTRPTRTRQDQPSGPTDTTVTLSIQSLETHLRHEVVSSTAEIEHTSERSMASIRIRRFQLDAEPGKQELRLGLLQISVGASRMLSFDQSTRNVTSSLVFSDDVHIMYSSAMRTNRGRAVTDVTLNARPITFELDLKAIDEAFSTFGGLGGVLDIGSSALTESSPLASPALPPRPSRVRFENVPVPTDTSPEVKAHVTIGGIGLLVRGEQCNVTVTASTTKCVYREKRAAVTLSEIQLRGPFTSANDEPPISVDLTSLRFDYLFSPQDLDIEHLITLLVPNRDKYDNDDDILIDTLIRQRQKGACLKINLDDGKAKVANWNCLSLLESLGTELSRLAVVTKYLPEDERPGLLTMIVVNKSEVRVPVNEKFGMLRITLQDLQCAQVGLPALLALSAKQIQANQVAGAQLVHTLVPLAGEEDLPMIMARMVGDEAEPVIKVKLYNMCVEYSVPIVLGLTGANDNKMPGEIVTDIIGSVATLAGPAGINERPKRVDSDKSNTTKQTNVSLLLHNSAIGLTPQKRLSKALFILTDARVSVAVPPNDVIKVSLELHEAAIFIIDDTQVIDLDPTNLRRNPAENTKVAKYVLSSLSQRGYISVGSISSAVLETRVETDATTGTSSIEVDVRDNFFLLETCADSTQTLIGILNGLAPPGQPNKQPQYLIEPMSIEDMISSFTGDAYEKPKKSKETLFDVEEEPGLDVDAMLNDSMLGSEPDDLLAESEMTSSLYGPVSGILGGSDDGTEKQDADTADIAESLLEDDPFEMADMPEDMPMSDAALLRDLRKQARPTKSTDSVDLGNYEIEDLGFDALGTEEQILGGRHRFNAPTSRRRLGMSVETKEKLPFKLKLRDVNFSWHLHDGYDWQNTRDGITAAVEQAEQRAEKRLARRRQPRYDPEEDESVIGDCMFNSVYITIPSNITEVPDIRRGINRGIDDLVSESESIPASGMSRPTTYSAGGRPIDQNQRQHRRLKLERSRHWKVSFELTGVSADILVFPTDSGEVQSSIDVRLKKLEIVDKVPTSAWNLFLHPQRSEGGVQELSKPMIHLNLLNVRTLASYAATEIVMHVSVQPLGLHVDQDTLDFITRFFEFKDPLAEPPAPPHEQPFLQRIEVDTVDLNLYYKPKRIDYVGLRSGHTSEFMNFINLEGANIRLRHAIIYGLHGFEPLHKTLNDIWMPDVTRNQLPTVLAGLAPVRTLVNIGSGVRSIVTVPVREYKKDGRIMRSIQKGAFHFGKTTTSELARLGAKVAIGTHNLLSGAEELLSPSSASSANQRLSSSPDWADDDAEGQDREKRAISAYADQPIGVLSGLRSARRHLEHDLLTAKDAFIAVQGELLESSGPGAAVKVVARHAPTVILRPIIGASKAVGTALLGVGNQVDKEGIRRMEDKYKRR